MLGGLSLEKKLIKEKLDVYLNLQNTLENIENRYTTGPTVLSRYSWCYCCF